MSKLKDQLKFIGFQEWPGREPIKLWNIYNSSRPDLHPDNSTVGLESLKEMGVIK